MCIEILNVINKNEIDQKLLTNITNGTWKFFAVIFRFTFIKNSFNIKFIDIYKLSPIKFINNYSFRVQNMILSLLE